MPKGNRTNHPVQVSTPGQRAQHVKKALREQPPEDDFEGEMEMEAYHPPPRYQHLEIDIPYPEGDWKRAFLEEFSRFPNVTAACRKAQISRVWAHKQRSSNKKFAELWDACLQGALDQLEQTVFERSLNPWDPGSATLSKWLLTHHRPETYNPAQRVSHDHEVHTRDDKPIQIQVETIDYRNFLGAIAPADRPLIEGEKVKDIEDEDLFGDFRELSAENDR